MQKENRFDAIVIGSGISGSTIARELSRSGWKVLILERGGKAPKKESLANLARITDEVKLGPNLTTVRGIATGGSSNLYFGVVYDTPLNAFDNLGIDISPMVESVRRELPIAPLPDELLGEQTIRLRESVLAQGHAWHKHDMLIDHSKCTEGYSYEALWRAPAYIDEALAHGATLITGVEVGKVLTDGNSAVGVEYRKNRFMARPERHRVYGDRIILSAGEVASPKILHDSGVEGVGERGFFCNPGYAIYGVVPGMKGKNSFVGSMGGLLEDGIELGDANISRFLHGPMMLSKLKLRHMFSYPETLGMSVKVRDSLRGGYWVDGSLRKEFTEEEHEKLKKGREEALRIMKKAGARHVFDFGVQCAGRVGGLISIGEQIDTNLETRFRNLHVCDGSVIPDSMRDPPALTLLSLSRYLAKYLVSSR